MDTILDAQDKIESIPLTDGNLEEQLRELHMLTALLANIADGTNLSENLKTNTAAWLIYEAAQRAELAHAIFLEEA